MIQGNIFAWLNDAITQLVTQNTGIFLGFGNEWMWNFFVATILLQAIAGLRDPDKTMEAWGQTFARLMVVMFMLRCYLSPVWGTDITIPDMVTRQGAQLAAVIDMSIMDTLFAKFHDIMLQAQPTTLWDQINPIPELKYMLTVILISLLQGAMVIVIAAGWVAVGLGKIFGPILIPTFILPRADRFFYGWVAYQIQYALYPAMANAIVWIFTKTFLNFLDQFAGPYTIPYLGSMLFIILALVVCMVFACFKVGAYTADMVRGGAGQISISGIGRVFG